MHGILATRISQPRFAVRLAKDHREIESALKLRSRVFNEELRVAGSEYSDPYDTTSRHLIVESLITRETVGTYRLNTIETVSSADGFYSANEFTIEGLPNAILNNGVEIGRACVSKPYRNTKVLFLLWSGLLKYLQTNRKRYFFGCCSIFTNDESQGAAIYKKLAADGLLHSEFSISPRRNAVNLEIASDEDVSKTTLNYSTPSRTQRVPLRSIARSPKKPLNR